MSVRTHSRRSPITAPALTVLAAATAALTLATAAPVTAQATRDRDARADTSRLVDRLSLRRADETLVSREGDFALLMVGPDLYLQLTDRGLDDIGTHDDQDTADTSLGSRLLGAMIRAGVRELLDHAIAYPIAELGRAEYVDGRLVLEDLEGKEIMNITLNGRDVLTDFRPQQARAFARELRRRMRADD